MSPRRLRLFRLLVLAALGLLVARLAQLQVLQGKELRQASEQNRIRRVREPAPRGLILDRAGHVLASNRAAYCITLLPQADAGQRRAVEQALEPLLGLPAGSVERRLQGAEWARGEAVSVASDVHYRTLARVEERAPFLPGVAVQVVPVRRYPYGSLACHLLGYVREVDQRELASGEEQGYLPGDLIGKSGVERAAERALRGREGGKQVEVDARGRPVRVLGRVEPQPGQPVTLTLQLAAQQAAAAGLRGRKGGAVALDPRTGEVLALCSSPGFDPNWFAGELSRERWAYLNGPSRPQQNRALRGRYEPGSVFKIVTAAAALEQGKATAGSRFYCPGHYQLGKWRFSCWRLSGHGALSFTEGIAQSCNVVFMTLGRRVGAEALAGMARRLGCGAPTGLDIGSESAGLVPDPEWKRRHRHQSWYPGDTCQLAIGQGDMLITPLQAAALVSVVANGGYRVQPHLVRAIGEERLPAPRPSPAGLSPQTIRLLRQGLEGVVQRGTARSLRGLGVAVAGKTGTAENPRGAPHAWFVGYAPADHPRVAVAVLVEGGGHGAAVAAPVAGRMIRAALGLEKGGGR